MQDDEGKTTSSLEHVDLEAVREEKGYVLDARQIESRGDYKLAPDGITILIPQPSDDSNDPLNWTWARKHTILFIISATALLPDYGSATGAATLVPQSVVWDISPDEVNHSQVGNVFMLGAGGIFVVALAAYFGRLPVLFWFTLVAFATAAWCAGASSFPSFMAARILNGFFSTVAQGGGLMFINDMFFFHEHARKINIWTAFIILSPYLGPLIASFIVTTQAWYWPFWVYFIMTGLCLLLIIFFMDETYYNRKIRPDQQPPRQSRLARLVGTEQFKSRHQRSTVREAALRPIKVIAKPVVFISTIYYLFSLAWAVGINTTLAILVGPLYGFGPKQIGFFYFTPIVAVILGEIIGHWLHDSVAALYAKRHRGRLEPEARLWVIWLATPLMVTGLIFIGFCLEKSYHFMLTAFAWGLYVFGYMVMSVAINAYLLDSYPEYSGEVAAWINFARTTGGFIVSYFQVNWANAVGPAESLGTQAAVCGAAFGLIVILQVWGKRLRMMSGR